MVVDASTCSEDLRVSVFLMDGYVPLSKLRVSCLSVESRCDAVG
jgi:hypothetical protein